MKKIYKKLLVLIIAFFMVPTSLLLVACGATAVNKAQGVSFVSDLQINGQAVFELDLNSPLVLPYKVNPSSAYGYAPRFIAVSGISGDNMAKFSLDIVSGEFCINDPTFKDVEVEIIIGNFKDTCKITLKEYPTQIGLYDENEFNKMNLTPSISLASGSAYQINVAAIFEDSEIINSTTGEKQPVLLSDKDYNFLIEADESSKTLINVPNSNQLNISTYNNYGTAKLKVALCDYYKNIIVDEEGNAKFAFEIEIHVYLPCSYMDIKLSTADELLSSKEENLKTRINAIELDYDNTKNAYIIKFSAEFYDNLERFIEDDNLRINCFADKTTFIEIDNVNKIIYAKRPPSGGSHDILLTFWSNGKLINGEYLVTNVILTINF